MRPEDDYPAETNDHRLLRDAIWSRLNGWRRFVIAVDGIDGVGKSTLARYLAWQLGMPVIESDLFLVPGVGRIEYRLKSLREVVASRVQEDRPVLFEGILALKILEMLGESADYLVWVEQSGREASRIFQQELTDYLNLFQPTKRADYIFSRLADDLMRARLLHSTSPRGRMATSGNLGRVSRISVFAQPGFDAVTSTRLCRKSRIVNRPTDLSVG